VGAGRAILVLFCACDLGGDKVAEIRLILGDCLDMWGGYMREKGEIRFSHPTQKPLKVFKIPIQDWTDKNDIIFDPYMGSGTCAVACQELGRNFIGIEIEPKYYEIAKRRIDQTMESLFV
jgi:DNA modification methylase